MSLSVITSSEGFVRIGLMAPKPSTETVLALCAVCNKLSPDGGNPNANDETGITETFSICERTSSFRTELVQVVYTTKAVKGWYRFEEEDVVF